MCDLPHLPSTHHCLFNVNFLTTGQAKVCYLCHQVVAYEDIPGCQIPVDELGEERRGIILVKHNLDMIHFLHMNLSKQLN